MTTPVKKIFFIDLRLGEAYYGKPQVFECTRYGELVGLEQGHHGLRIWLSSPEHSGVEDRTFVVLVLSRGKDVPPSWALFGMIKITDPATDVELPVAVFEVTG